MRLFVNCFAILFFIISTSFEVNNNTMYKPTIATGPSDTFPVPSNQNNMVFYVQRNHNINTIVYEINYNDDHTINENEPIHEYWIRYADDGGIKELSYLQKHYAYGIESKLVDKEKKIFKLNFVSYKDRDIYLKQSPADNKYHAYININGKLSLLNKVFIQIEGGSFWVPHVKYVEISGQDISSKKAIIERFNP